MRKPCRASPRGRSGEPSVLGGSVHGSFRRAWLLRGRGDLVRATRIESAVRHSLRPDGSCPVRCSLHSTRGVLPPSLRAGAVHTCLAEAGHAALPAILRIHLRVGALAPAEGRPARTRAGAAAASHAAGARLVTVAAVLRIRGDVHARAAARLRARAARAGPGDAGDARGARQPALPAVGGVGRDVDAGRRSPAGLGALGAAAALAMIAGGSGAGHGARAAVSGIARQVGADAGLPGRRPRAEVTPRRAAARPAGAGEPLGARDAAAAAVLRIALRGDARRRASGGVGARGLASATHALARVVAGEAVRARAAGLPGAHAAAAVRLPARAPRRGPARGSALDAALGLRIACRSLRDAVDAGGAAAAADAGEIARHTLRLEEPARVVAAPAGTEVRIAESVGHALRAVFRELAGGAGAAGERLAARSGAEPAAAIGGALERLTGERRRTRGSAGAAHRAQNERRLPADDDVVVLDHAGLSTAILAGEPSAPALRPRRRCDAMPVRIAAARARRRVARHTTAGVERAADQAERPVPAWALADGPASVGVPAGLAFTVGRARGAGGGVTEAPLLGAVDTGRSLGATFGIGGRLNTISRGRAAPLGTGRRAAGPTPACTSRTAPASGATRGAGSPAQLARLGRALAVPPGLAAIRIRCAHRRRAGVTRREERAALVADVMSAPRRAARAASTAVGAARRLQALEESVGRGHPVRVLARALIAARLVGARCEAREERAASGGFLARDVDGTAIRGDARVTRGIARLEARAATARLAAPAGRRGAASAHGRRA
jgi:hypothetical protein